MPTATAPREFQRCRTLGYATGTQPTQTRAHEASAIAVATGIAGAARTCSFGARAGSRVARQHGGWKANRLSAPTASIRIWLWRGEIKVAYFESPSKS